MSSVPGESDSSVRSPAMAVPLMKLSIGLTAAGVGLTALIWGWVLSSPEGTFGNGRRFHGRNASYHKW